MFVFIVDKVKNILALPAIINILSKNML